MRMYRGFYVVEQKPCKRIIHIQAEGYSQNHYLHFPATIFMVKRRNFRKGWLLQFYFKLNNKAIKTGRFLPNINHQSVVCTPKIEYEFPLQAIHSFWNSSFMCDFWDYFNDFQYVIESMKKPYWYTNKDINFQIDTFATRYIEEWKIT